MVGRVTASQIAPHPELVEGGIRRVVLVALHIGLHVARRHHADLMAERRDLARPIVRARASLHPHKTRRQLLEKGENLPAAQLAADNGLARRINAVDLKNGLRKIQPDRGNFCHRTAPFLAVHTETALWHIAMPVVGAVHSIKSRHLPLFPVVSIPSRRAFD